MKLLVLSRKIVITRSRYHDPQIGLVRCLLLITVAIMGFALYTVFR